MTVSDGQEARNPSTALLEFQHSRRVAEVVCDDQGLVAVVNEVELHWRWNQEDVAHQEILFWLIKATIDVVVVVDDDDLGD